ncbi:MAG: PadR family transcriptional regulator [Syntrophomonas sp.]
MSLRYGILGLLNYGSMTGYDISKYFRESVGYFWNAQQSQIYRELTALEKDGLVEYELVIQSDKPNKKLYRINEVGRENLNGWLYDFNIDDFFITRNALLLKLFFSSQIPVNRTIEMLSKYKERCEAAARELALHTGDLSDYQNLVEDDSESLYWKMTAARGLADYQASARWAGECINILRKRGEQDD